MLKYSSAFAKIAAAVVGVVAAVAKLTTEALLSGRPIFPTNVAIPFYLEPEIQTILLSKSKA